MVGHRLTAAGTAAFLIAVVAATPALAAGGALPPIVHDVGLGLLAAGVLGVVFARFGIPSIAAFLAAGVIIGPLGLGLVTEAESVETIAEIGFVLLLFMIGLEIDIRSLLGSGRTAVLAAAVQYPLTLLLGVLLANLVIMVGLGSLISTPLAPFYIGVAIAGSSSLMVVALFQRHFELDTRPGHLAIGILIVHDIWAVVISLVQPTLNSPDIKAVAFSFLGIILLIAIAVIFARYVVASVFRWIAKSPELILLGAVSWCFAMVVVGLNLDNITELAGFNWHMAVGSGLAALIAGATIANLPFATEIVTKVGLLKDFFSTLFFVGLGISIPAIHGVGVPLLALVIAAVALLARQFILFPILYRLGVDQRNAEVTSIRLAQMSEFGLVIAYLGVYEGHIDEELGSVITIAFIVTAVLTTPLYRRAYRIHAWLKPVLARVGFSEPAADEHDHHKEHHTLALLGLHRDASSLLNDLAEKRPDLVARTVVVDFNVALHDAVRALGAKVEYGDISNEDALRHAGVGQAKIIISTISDDLLRGTSNRDLVKMLRKLNPTATIIANAVDIRAAESIYEAGASYVYMARLEVARALDEMVAHALRGTLDQYKGEQLRRSGILKERREVLS